MKVGLKMDRKKQKRGQSPLDSGKQENLLRSSS
jgi:hypothetical protein